jgi:hypothetical protein
MAVSRSPRSHQLGIQPGGMTAVANFGAPVCDLDPYPMKTNFAVPERRSADLFVQVSGPFGLG